MPIASRLALLALGCTLAAVLAAAQGIRSRVAQLDLPGEWRERAEWLAGIDAGGGQVFYDAASAAVVHVRPGHESWAEADLDGLVAQLREIETGPPARPAVARLIASAFFPLPQAYRMRGGRRSPPPLWETDGVPGHAQWFYTSQITPGLAARRVGRDTYFEEDFAALRLLRGERRGAGAGEAVVFEIETEQPAVAEAVRRFGIEPARGQRLRYGWVLYAPGGFRTAAGMVSVGFAAPAAADLNADAILTALTR